MTQPPERWQPPRPQEAIRRQCAVLLLLETSAGGGVGMRSRHTGQKRCQNIPEFAGDSANVPSSILRSQENVLFAAMRLVDPLGSVRGSCTLVLDGATTGQAMFNQAERNKISLRPDTR